LGGASARYCYDGWQVIAEVDSGGSILKKYVNGPRVDEILAQKTPSQTVYLTRDGLGSTREITDTAGAVLQRFEYDAFGAVTVLDSLGNPSTGGVAMTNYLFTGRELQPESGLYNYRNRFYHSGLGRFLQPDPIGLLGGNNIYSYVLNDPINAGDPLGLALWKKLYKVYQAVKQARRQIAQVNELSNKKAAQEVARHLDQIDTSKGLKRVVEAQTDTARDTLAKRLSTDKKLRGPEQSRGYPEHVHPNAGPYKDVHIQTKTAIYSAAIVSALLPYSSAVAQNQNATPGDVVGAAAWDIASTIDPFFITDAAELAAGFDPEMYDDTCP